ncbi:hypothetical protein AB1K09_06370 [Solibacillus silvestris]
MEYQLKVEFINELPFMIQLPKDEYIVKHNCMDGNERDFVLSINNDIYRLYINPFANFKNEGRYIDGEKDELETIIINNGISTYSFAKLKTYVTCTFKETITLTEEQIDSITEKEIINYFIGDLIKKSEKTLSVEELEKNAQDKFAKSTADELYLLKKYLILRKYLNRLASLVYDYQNALNVLIKNYSYIRDDFFVEPLTMHTLEGTITNRYIDHRLDEQIKAAGKIPTIITNGVWMNPMSEEDLKNLKQRLELKSPIPATKSLILAAKNLFERGEYRSAIIEANAALEIAVSDKITEKMKLAGDSEQDIENYLGNTETNFYQRCDQQLKKKASKSFVRDNSTLWTTINSNRKAFRHKIAHSSLIPNPKDVGKIIDDYEQAILWVESL